MKKVYIFTVTAGAGHLKAAEALEKTYRDLMPNYQVKVIDVLDYTNALFKKNYSESYVKMIKMAPELWGLVYDKTDDPTLIKKINKFRNVYNSLNASAFIKLIKSEPPDLAICTHFLPAEILSDLSTKNEIKFPWATVVTDFEIHLFWVFKNTPIYFVTSELAKFQLQRNGIISKNIHVTGIPIDPAFSKPKNRNEILRKMGLSSSKQTILIMSGGFGMGPVEKIAENIQHVDADIQCIFIAGKNNVLKEKLTNMNFRIPTKVFGFVDNVDEFLAISDLLVSKPGGLTTSEALSQGLPMVILNPIPGQETRNKDYLLENGAAISVSALDDIGFRISQIYKEKGRIQNMKYNAKNLARPYAGKLIIEEIERRFNNGDF